MKINVTVDLDDISTYCEATATEEIKDVIHEEIRKRVRAAIKPVLSKLPTDDLQKAAQRAYAIASKQAIMAFMEDKE